MLATGADDGKVVLWKHQTKHQAKEGEREAWRIQREILASPLTLLDLSWAPTSRHFATGSSKTASVWSADSVDPVASLTRHKHFVEGVAWDPCGQYIVTMSTDRTLAVHRVPERFGRQQTLRTVSRVSSVRPPPPADNPDAPRKRVPIFRGETSLFRRCGWSPDGAFLLAPGGQFLTEGGEQQDATYVFARHSMDRPLCHLPSRHATIAARFAPVLFRCAHAPPAEGAVEAVFTLQRHNGRRPYRMVFAVAATEQVMIYDTHQPIPLAVIGSLHFAPITDLAWSPDGHRLLVTSSDGFVSSVSFDRGELGEVLSMQEAAPYLSSAIPQYGGSLRVPTSTSTSTTTAGKKVLPVKHPDPEPALMTATPAPAHASPFSPILAPMEPAILVPRKKPRKGS